MTDDSHDAQLQAWVGLQRELQAILYESDPDRMGATVGAPDDEYYDVAIELIRFLRERPPNQSVAEVVLHLSPEAKPDLVSAVERAWTRYIGKSPG